MYLNVFECRFHSITICCMEACVIQTLWNILFYFFFLLLCHVTCWCCWTSKWIFGLLEYFLTNRKYSSVEQTHGYTMHQLIHQINRFDNLILLSDILYSTDTTNIFTCLMFFSIHILRVLLCYHLYSIVLMHKSR